MKALLLFGDELDRKALLESGKYLRDNFGFELVPLYIRDIKRSEAVPYAPDGMILDDMSSVTIEQWKLFED
ncbi:MAG: hypothetical protein ACRCZH_00240, partial [Cetobacterium sp.]